MSVKITDEDLFEKGVRGLPNTPELSQEEMQDKLDEIATDVIVPKFNELSDEVDTILASIPPGVRIIDNLESDLTTASLSANQGRVLKGMVDDLDEAKADIENPVFSGKVSANRKAGTTEGANSVTLGNNNEASGDYSTAIGNGNKATAEGSFAGGSGSEARNKDSVAIGTNVIAGKDGQTVVGKNNVINSDALFVVGNGTDTSNRSNVLEAKPNEVVFNKAISLGRKANTTVGTNSVAVGTNVEASGSYSHAECRDTTASGYNSHAEGAITTASGSDAHAEGFYTTASGDDSHAEGYHSIASGERSHAEGRSTIASGHNSHVEGKFNIEDTQNKYAHIIGNGTDDANRRNAFTVDWQGKVEAQGDIVANKDSANPISMTSLNASLANIYKIAMTTAYNTSSGYVEIPIHSSRILSAVTNNWTGAYCTCGGGTTSNSTRIYFRSIESGQILTDTRIQATIWYVNN